MSIKNRVVAELLPADSGQVVEFHVTNILLTSSHETHFTLPLRQNRQWERVGERVQSLLNYFFAHGAESVRLFPRKIVIVLGGAYRPDEVCADFAKTIGREFFGKSEFDVDASSITPRVPPRVSAHHYSPSSCLVDYDDLPAAIVAVEKGEPLVLLVSEETLNDFNRAKKRLGLSHVEMANRLRDSICRDGGQFHRSAVAAALRSY